MTLHAMPAPNSASPPSLEAEQAQALNIQGVALAHAGRLAEAAAHFQEALCLCPQRVDIRRHRALALERLGQTQEALEELNVLVQTTASSALAEDWSWRGLLLEAIGCWREALSSHTQALVVQPNQPRPLLDLARVLKVLQAPRDAAQCLSQARTLALGCTHPDAALLNDIGVMQADLGLRDEAMISYQMGLACFPCVEHEAALQRHLGSLLQDLGHPQEALQALEISLRLEPRNALALANRGNALSELGWLEDALASFDQAIAVAPNDPEAHWNKALALLLAGRYAEGWPLYEWRWKRVLARRPWVRDTSTPLWLGQSSLSGRSILVHAEQGLGDALQMCRYLPVLQSMGAQVHLEVQASLVDLMRTLPGVTSVWARGRPVTDFPPLDWQCPMMSLPLALGTTLDTIPPPAPLRPDRRLQEECLRDLLKTLGPPAAGPKFGRIGVCFTGGPMSQGRSLDASLWQTLMTPDRQWVHLNREPLTPSAEAGGFPPTYWHPEPWLEGFERTAALCNHMDLVITVDTSLAHLSASLGIPTWVMLPWAADWRWLERREDSPWYPSIRLFRQDAPHDGLSVVRKVSAALLEE